jgi:hypothetical protein
VVEVDNLDTKYGLATYECRWSLQNASIYGLACMKTILTEQNGDGITATDDIICGLVSNLLNVRTTLAAGVTVVKVELGRCRDCFFR